MPWRECSCCFCYCPLQDATSISITYVQYGYRKRSTENKWLPDVVFCFTAETIERCLAVEWEPRSKVRSVIESKSMSSTLNL
jgi:hypothetical protein